MYISYLRQKKCLFWVSQCRKQETGGPGKWFFAQMSRRCFAQILHRKLVNLMEANEITYLIRGAAFRVHTALGPGLLESVYEAYDIPAIVKQATRITHKFQYKQAGG